MVYGWPRMKKPPKKMRLRLYLRDVPDGGARTLGRHTRSQSTLRTLRPCNLPSELAAPAPAPHPSNSNPPLGVEVRQLANVVRDHAAQALHHVRRVVRLKLLRGKARQGGRLGGGEGLLADASRQPHRLQRPQQAAPCPPAPPRPRTRSWLMILPKLEAMVLADRPMPV